MSNIIGYCQLCEMTCHREFIQVFNQTFLDLGEQLAAKCNALHVLLSW